MSGKVAASSRSRPARESAPRAGHDQDAGLRIGVDLALEEHEFAEHLKGDGVEPVGSVQPGQDDAGRGRSTTNVLYGLIMLLTVAAISGGRTNLVRCTERDGARAATTFADQDPDL